MYRTPPKSVAEEKEAQKSPPKTFTLTSKVRRSIGEWEAVVTEQSTATPLSSLKTQAGPARDRPRPALSQDSATSRQPPAERRNLPKTYPDKTSEARAYLCKAKQHMAESRNLKTVIKNGVTEAINKLYQIVKELEVELKKKETGKGKEEEIQSEKITVANKPNQNHDLLFTRMEQHIAKLEESNQKMAELKNVMDQQKEVIERTTYASVAANTNIRPHCANRETLHSVVVASTDETESGEEVLDRVRRVVDAKEGWVTVEKVRKAKDRRVILGFKTREEQEKVTQKLGKTENHLLVEEVKNKDPLFVLRDVLSINTDEDVLKALRNQNRDVFRGLDEGDDRIVVKYRRRARNPHTGHIVLSTSPKIWRRVVELGVVRIDLQQIRVADQSPLVQCTRCLSYGHSKRFCREAVDLCSHCGGPHMRAECTEWLADAAPSCRNCARAGMGRAEHNAFSQDCPVRRRWDALARSATAYC